MSDLRKPQNRSSARLTTQTLPHTNGNFGETSTYTSMSTTNHPSTAPSAASVLHAPLATSPPPTPAANAPKRRVRTGCQTCRLKKIKCDERKPRCANCDRAGRQCEYVNTYRNHHNPMLNEAVKENLPSFYNNRPKFGVVERGAFLPVPEEVKWLRPVTVGTFREDYEVDYGEGVEGGGFGGLQGMEGMRDVRGVASSGLQALSAAAAGFGGEYPGLYASNASAVGANAIDPNLEGRRGSGGEDAEHGGRTGGNAVGDTADQQLARALQIHAQQGEGVVGQPPVKEDNER